MKGLVLSLFPGIDLLGRAFEAEGFCVVRGPDLIFGGDIRSFHVPAGRFDGIIGGPPCVEFSSLNRDPDYSAGESLILEFLRVVDVGRPTWFLMENCPRVPSVEVPGYKMQRIDVRGGECGLKSRRLRHFQFGGVGDVAPLIVPRHVTGDECDSAATASEGRRQGRRGWKEFCELQGLPPLELPGMTVEAKYRAVGNGVPLPMGRLMARAIADWPAPLWANPCACGCGRPVPTTRTTAGPACRKRMERARKGESVTSRVVRIVDESPISSKNAASKIPTCSDSTASMFASLRASGEADLDLFRPDRTFLASAAGHGDSAGIA